MSYREPTTTTSPTCLTQRSTRSHRSHSQQQDRIQITYVTHQIEDGVDPDFVRRQAGHTYQSTTAIYSGVSTDFMNTMMRKALDTAFATDEERQR
jgi:site-specific recombinase XerD